MNRKHDIHRLTERFFDGETTRDEEQRLYRYFQGSDISDDLLPMREIFLAFSALQVPHDEHSMVAKVPSIQTKANLWLRWGRFAAAAVVAFGVFGAATRSYHEQNYCEAYVNNRRLTDREVVMDRVAQTMQVIDKSGATDVDNQLHELFDE
ncbi:hypothetical protein [Prevotella sp.]|uniref:hypothetical protein n=1 Tax=Prevotella sp. TaxID=59823 RepID=UPI002F94A8C4